MMSMIFVVIMVVVVAGGGATYQSEEEVVWRNARIHTLDGAMAEAVCFNATSGFILSVGSEKAVLEACSGRVVDLRGATVTPGLTDSHAHLMLEANRRLHADLADARNASDALELMQAWASEHDDAWLLGDSWDENAWHSGEFPTSKDLDGLDRPCFLLHVSGHAAWLNEEGMRRSGIDNSTRDPEGGAIVRYEGEPTGVLTDAAMDLVKVPPPSISAIDASLDAVIEDCLRHGLTGVHDLAALDEDIELYKAKDLPIRVYAFRDAAMHAKPPELYHSDKLIARGAKFFQDGAMGSWSASMLAPYSDKPDSTGTSVYTRGELRGNMSEWARRGYQVAVHAIGDAANRDVLDAYESLNGLRWRVEHAQILSESDLPRFSELGVIASMQPSHCASDLNYALKRLGEDRCSRAYAWASILATQPIAMPLGSDFPTAGSIPPLLGFHAAVTRQTPEGLPLGGFYPEERLSRTQALRGFTSDAAFASFRENELGKVKQGFRADLTVFDADILTVDADEILNTTVLATLVGGQLLYATASFPGRVSYKKKQPLNLDADTAARVQKAHAKTIWQRCVIDANEDKRHRR